jgi:energy-coupling factor transporter ATP-binding protein EcfA2
MLSKLTIRNFKRFGEVAIELGNRVVFIGPNNSGKTSALQALALWYAGLQKWQEKRQGKVAPEKRPGVTINRKDLIAVPVPEANLLWRNLRVRNVTRTSGRQLTENIRINIVVDGVTGTEAWTCGLEFDYANEESFYCRPLRLPGGEKPERMPIPPGVSGVRVVFLPPMSGLAANETRLDQGAINVRIGEGRTAEVLRNLCHGMVESDEKRWREIVASIHSLFGVELLDPKHIKERGEIIMSYRERGIRLDLSSSGRGLQQTLLVLTYMYANPRTVLLLDEPDAHLEILRQRQIYQLLKQVASENENQIIAASHSEVLLNEAAGQDVVVAFVGRPHRIDDRGSQVAKSLKEIGFEDYYLAEKTGWVLYLEGPTDLAILQGFARKLEHVEAQRALERPFVKYVGNQPEEARKHFYGIREAVPHLKGVAIFQRLDQDLPADLGAEGLTWRCREIENYLCYPETLEAYARATGAQADPGPLFEAAHLAAMQKAVSEVEKALGILGKGSPWDARTKVSEEFLAPVFERYFAQLELPNLMRKTNFHELVAYVPASRIDPEVREKLDAIAGVASSGQPVEEDP